MGDDDEIELQKASIMEMRTNDGDISMTTTRGLEQAKRDYKKFLYARVTHSNHAIQYDMQQIMERQNVVNEYRSMMVERIDLTPLDLNSYESDLVVISHIIRMIEEDNFWHHKTFEAVLADLWRSQDEESTKKKRRLCTVQKMTEPTESWMRKKLLTSAVNVGLQPVKSAMEKKAGNKKVTIQRRAKQSQGWTVKIGLKRIIKQMKLRKLKQ